MEQSALNFFLACGLNGLARTAGMAEASGMWEAPQVPNPTCEEKESGSYAVPDKWELFQELVFGFGT